MKSLSSYHWIALQENISFVDASFPPAPKSLYKTEQADGENKVDKWLRPNEIVTDVKPGVNWTVYRTPLSSDITQGLLVFEFLCTRISELFAHQISVDLSSLRLSKVTIGVDAS